MLIFEPNKLVNRLMTYNWQQEDWPHFRYNLEEIRKILEGFQHQTSYITGVLKGMPEKGKSETIIKIMLSEAMKTSAIEGEYLSRIDVLSSIRNKLGFHDVPAIKDKKSQGAGELMVEVRNTYKAPLSEEMLLSWHFILMKEYRKINAGKWRTQKEPMQVISGSIGKEKIHFEAPPSSRIQAEMKKYIKWFNESAPGNKNEIQPAPVRAAIAHLYFESIHPFEDGNGRIGRAIAEKALSQSVGRPVVMSLSTVIESKRNLYYEALKKAQETNEITAWIKYFTNVIFEAQKYTYKIINLTLNKSRFMDKFRDELNERQLKVVSKIFNALSQGEAGGMTAKKYMSITKSSKATATRDLQQLTDMKILEASGGGRSVSYKMKF
jgi:Fic family protein